MASEANKAALLLAVATVGIAFVALPWLPKRAPEQLPARFELASPAGRGLLSVLQWHDEACMQGDLAGFRERVTPDYAKGFARRLQQLGRPLDAAALRAYIGGDPALGLAAMAQRQNLGGFADGDRACFVVGATLGMGGVQGVAFRRVDGTFRLDAIEHQPSVAAADARAVAAFARRLVSGP